MNEDDIVEPYHRQKIKKKWNDVITYIRLSQHIYIPNDQEKKLKHFETLIKTWPNYLSELKCIIIVKGERGCSFNTWNLLKQNTLLIIYQSPFNIVIKGTVTVCTTFLITEIINFLIDAIKKEKKILLLNGIDHLIIIQIIKKKKKKKNNNNLLNNSNNNY